MREVVEMAKAKADYEWSHTARLAYVQANAMRSSKSPQLEEWMFHPMRTKPQVKLKKLTPDQSIELLAGVLCGNGQR